MESHISCSLGALYRTERDPRSRGWPVHSSLQIHSLRDGAAYIHTCQWNLAAATCNGCLDLCSTVLVSTATSDVAAEGLSKTLVADTDTDSGNVVQCVSRGGVASSLRVVHTESLRHIIRGRFTYSQPPPTPLRYDQPSLGESEVRILSLKP